MLDKLKSAFLYAKDFCEDTADNIKETVVTAVDCAKLHYRIVSMRNELNSLYAVLGKALMNGGEDEASQKEEQINALIERINAKEELLSGLLDQYRIVSGKVICPDCGKFLSEKYPFCPYCGNRVNELAEEDDYSDVTEEELEDVREIDEL